MIEKHLTPTLSYQLIYYCEAHGRHEGIYCKECKWDRSRPHDIWGDQAYRFVVSK